MKELDLDALERLSRWRAGELPADEAAEVEAALASDPALREGLARLEAIDRLAAELPALPEADADRLARAALAETASGRRWLPPVLAAAVGAAAAAILVVALEAPAPLLVLAEGPVTVDDRAAAAGPLAAGSRLATGADAAALLALDGATVSVGRHGAVRVGDPIELVAGTLHARGPAVELRADGVEVRLAGAALLSTEPAEALARVTTERRGPEGAMGYWRMLGPAAAGLAVGSAVTLVVLEGDAEVRQGEAPPVRVEAGERWTGGKVVPAKPALAERTPTPLEENGARDSDEIAARAATPGASPATMTREALVAEVTALRTERESLLREKRSLLRQLDGVTSDARRQGTYHRIAPEQLVADAERGRLRLRLPHVFRGPDEELFGPEARRDAELTPAEEAAVKAIYADSAARIHRGLGELYVEIGGDPAAVPTMATDSLFRELQAKSHGDDLKAAIRLAAQERAGLVPVGAGGPPVVRAVRLLWQEDDRVIDELDRLLGPDRAQRLLDHDEASHSDASFHVGE